MNKENKILLNLDEAIEYTGLKRNRLLDISKIPGFPVIIFPRSKNVYKRRIADMVFKE